jgi:hypothetical protein
VPIARLSIDLEARLAGLQQGLDKAGVLAEKQAAKIDAAFAGLKTTAAGLGVAFAAIIPAAVVGQFAQFFRTTVNGLDALNDLSDATGASVENLSALEDIALRTGTSLETAGDAVIKMNKALADAKPGTDAAEAFKALGLSVEELKRLDPVQAFQKLAIALSGFADDGNKARFVQELFGKSLREVAPLLKDAAENGKLNATVTTAQAKAAEAFNKELFALQKNALDAARTISGPLIASLNQLATAIKVGGGISGAVGLDKLPDSVDKVVAAYRLIGLARERITPLDILKNDPSNERALAELARIDAKAKGITASFNQANEELKKIAGAQAFRSAQLDAGNPANLDARDLRLQQLPSLPSSLGGGKAAKGKAPWTLAQWEQDLRITFDRAFIDLNDRGRDEQQKDLQKRIDAATQMTDELRDKNLRLTVDLVEDEKARAKALILLDEQVQLKKLESLQVYGQAYVDAQELIRQNTELALRGADLIKEKSDDVAKDIGLVFSSAAGEAITKWEGFSNLLKGILADLAQIAVKKTITEPLGNFLTDSLKGFSLANLFAANGQAFGAGGQVQPFARGGVVDSPTLFKFAKGTGLMGEAGPEAILPLQRGRGGKLGVAVQGGMGRALTYAPVINIDSRSDQAQVAQLVGQMLAADKQALFEYMRAQGAM